MAVRLAPPHLGITVTCLGLASLAAACGGPSASLQGAGASLMGVASLIGPTLFTGAFALGIRPDWGAPLPGAPYLVAAILLLVALATAAHATRPDATDPGDQRP